MTDGRHAADGEACNCSHEIGICAADGFSRISADAFFVHAVCAAGEDQNWLAAGLAAKDERLDDLSQFTACAVCGFLRRARGLGMFDHGVVITKRIQ